MSKGLERRLELLKNRALSDLDSIPTTAISICEKSNDEVMEAYETIKQALLNAQELEKENKELIKKADCCLWKDCNKISQENQELKDTNMKYAKLIDDFLTKNMRLEKALEILKDKFNFELDKPIPNGLYPLVYENRESGVPRLAKGLSQQEYELLKEVLEK